MTAFNFRSLLLAAIVLSNCITWTASRHHYAHNVHQHRTRHRRQGAGLYLPASYIIPGQEGRSENDGGWGEWGPVSPCSRTCGGGVASQKRICLQIGQDGQPQCQGGDTKYFSCQTQDCPAGSGDFRAEQCAEFNDKEFRGFKYNWVPYTKAPNPCELNCMPHGERFYFRHKLKVVDGTRCNEDSFDVCVDGRCQQVGCDMMLGSNAREDKCRECRGNGANCRTTAGIIDSQDLIKGYNDVLLIPEGSTTIIIEEIDASNNYLALRAKNDTYYLNGHYHIDFPRTIMIAGALWTYERSQQGFAAPDKLRCLGPTTEPLYLSLLLQDVNVGIRYEYSVPKDQAPPAHKQYNWVHEEFTPCSATCGGGFQTRNVTCRSREELEIVDDELCDAGLKPPTNQTCNTDPCPAEWNEGPWGNCSQRCGSGGVRSREVTCQKIIANGIKSIVEDTECFERLGPKPKLFESCNEDAPCPTWFVGRWKPCSELCDEGKQTRQVVCHQKKNGRVEVLSDENCLEEKPEAEKSCLLRPCEGIDWVTSDWVGCDNCLSKTRTRRVVCATYSKQVINDSFCSYHTRPADQEECEKVPECDVQWYATQWSKCSVSCGEGVQTRKVFCGVLNDDAVVILEDEKCKDIPRYKDSKPCQVPKEDCPPEWFAGPWENCTKECGGGEQSRRVMCFKGDQPFGNCTDYSVLEASQFCNTGPCNEDELLGVTEEVKDPNVYCEDEEDYEEVGVDEDLSTTTNEMMSDSPSPSATPLEDLTEEGSGESTFSTGTDWTTTDSDYETGSGDISTTDEPLSSSPKAAKESESIPRSSVVPSSSTEATTETGETDTTGTATDETTSTGTDETGSTDTDSTGSTTEGETGSTTEYTGTTETDITTESSTTLEDSSSTGTESTDSTVTSETGSTESSVSADTKETGSTIESSSPVSITSPTDTTGSTSSGETETTESSGSTSSDVSTDETGSTEATSTEETGSTESTTTDVTDTDFTDTSNTETTGTEDTESTVTEETSSTESTVTETTVTSETESTVTSETESTETETTLTGSTDSESTSTDSTEESTTGVSVSGSTGSSTTTTVAMPTEKSSSDASETTEGSTESSGSTVESSTTERESTTESGSTVEETGSTTVGGSTLETESTVESSTASGSEETTEQSTTVSGVESSTVSESGSTTEAAETSESGSTPVGSSTLSGSESTTEVAESSSDSSTETGETTESSTTVGSESTTEGGSTTEGEESTTETGETSSTGATESTEESSTTESGSTEESTTEGLSTTEGSTIAGSTEESGSTTEGLTTTEGPSIGSSPWDKVTVLVPHTARTCIPRPKKCKNSRYGCCPDGKTAAKGPFDAECKTIHNCKESPFKCCPDGVSPAQGPNFKGCPIEPCADTLFGCCQSDNKTAAQGNDQEGCPPPPPACASSKFGCCADNETEASGPEKEGCPETETTTTGATTETTTDTTESIETSEGSTTAEGTSTETATEYASTTLDPCTGFQYGCCADNQTESPGPDGQGCPCEATEYGCCSDGKTPAKGEKDAGCPGPCSTSQHGCCEDGQTPAHGPDFEGCCLLHAFGCCPDNRKPAEGPHLEGCGCQYTRHGCCPDNVTIAQGPGNEGCGCQYSQHGCCPDKHTIALGPNFEGCACHTYQFGCCPDGVTTAKGPEQQGCHCFESPFGCCGDEETHATGPEKAGCDCSTSKYGCCPDGVTEATGSKFLGCTDAPENKQASCSLPTDPGSCHNFTAMWYYDLAYGGCSRFWYGGCEGNGNRFATKEECEDVCVQPAPKDACKLPSVKGACDAEYTRWHYNSTMEQCVQFRYGGCLGNANNFDSRELCQKQCEPTTVEGQCKLPIESGSCSGNYSRWGFNVDSGKCERFTWGGCEGNSNRFSTEAACLLRCLIGAQPPQCSEPQEAGTCSDKQALWSFSVSENRCMPFYYSGCGGNHNRFTSREACEQTCPSAYEIDKCTLPAETGECSNYRERWFYDTAIKRCRQFYYGGCGGNENNFNTEAECEGSCAELQTTTTTTTARPTQPQQQRPENPEPAEYCLLEIDAGPCNDTVTRYAYDSALGRCVTFEYGGCGGNQNNFPDYEYCSLYCGATQDICQLPMMTGPCEASLQRFFYDPATDSCSQFTYGGCEGNDNRFETREACESRCRSRPAPRPTPSPTTITPPPAVDIPAECRSAQETCSHGGVVWYFDPTRSECVSHANYENGSDCRYSNTYSSQEGCERSCGAFKGVDVCKQRMDPGPCRAYMPKVYFDASTGQCREFVYGGCLGGANRFSSVDECSQVCKSEIEDVCSLPPEEGNCFSYIPQWYYDTLRDQCLQFVYTGCSGNDNRFETKSDCESRCKRPTLTTTTTVAPPQQTEESECKTPSSLEPCGANVTMFYYDSERRQCLTGEIGNCGHPNTYRTEEECERRCGAFVGLDPCGSHLDPGPCRASIPKFYWDSITASCQEYSYGGCDGGPNRFSTVDECESVCKAFRPPVECLQRADVGAACGLPPGARYHYSAALADCVVFAYLGCGGNGNNFRSYQQCLDHCTPNLQPDVVDCSTYRMECDALDCKFGTLHYEQDGCERCICKEDPCLRANCSASEHCEVYLKRDPGVQGVEYAAKCIAEENEVFDCGDYVEHCSRLQCEYGVQRARLPNGCEQCSCVQVEVDCRPLQEECDQLICNYGMDKIPGPDGCERCKCKDYPCASKSCAAGERCVVSQYWEAVNQEMKYSADCHQIVKPGACPVEQTTTNEVTCRRDCKDDADCRGVGKCCRRGCSSVCTEPVEQTSPHPLITTLAPDVPAAPQALPAPEPQVEAAEGGKATLRCLFHGNPPPKITWKYGEVTIDGNAGRYRLQSDGALEIVSLYRNDTGVYICVADNGLGQATQEIYLAVTGVRALV
ncbi:hypothetical protein B5X24_HaOG207687 [Helicoverpa armigera]|uniref:Hemolin n=1 Tax=Helicoverpa armigera TaxID=29058 RepID=A0A2W1BS27_HELAM|nr:hypothetical protein B5X24_HaOG207687 [Helicoverpa armigera]